MNTKTYLVIGLWVLTHSASAQIPRERSASANEIAEPFLATSIITLPSTTQLPTNNLLFTIQHAFGPVSNGIRGFYGLDAPANIRFGLDYGVTQNVMLGVGRSRFDQVVDLRTKARILMQETGGFPVGISFYGNLAFDTQEIPLEFSQRISHNVAALFSRQIHDALSIQITPSWTHFNVINENPVFGGGIEIQEADILALGMAARYLVGEKFGFSLEYIPVIGDRSDGTNNVLSIGMNVETGGHIFQMFLTSTQWITPQYVVSRSRNEFLDGDFGFGFNIHRVFGTGGH